MQNNANNTPSETLEFKYAGFGIRLLAYIIDNLILGIGLLFIKFFFFLIRMIIGSDILVQPVLFQYTWVDIIVYILRIMYFVLLTYFTSATLGKHLLKLKVISTNDTGKYSFLDILYRETIGRFLSKLIIYAGYLMIFINKDKSSLHDMLADTRVVYKSKTEEKINSITIDEEDVDNMSYVPLEVDSDL